MGIKFDPHSSIGSFGITFVFIQYFFNEIFEGRKMHVIFNLFDSSHKAIFLDSILSKSNRVVQTVVYWKYRYAEYCHVISRVSRKDTSMVVASDAGPHLIGNNDCLVPASQVANPPWY